MIHGDDEAASVQEEIAADCAGRVARDQASLFGSAFGDPPATPEGDPGDEPTDNSGGTPETGSGVAA